MMNTSATDNNMLLFISYYLIQLCNMDIYDTSITLLLKFDFFLFKTFSDPEYDTVIMLKDKHKHTRFHVLWPHNKQNHPHHFHSWNDKTKKCDLQYELDMSWVV